MITAAPMANPPSGLMCRGQMSTRSRSVMTGLSMKTNQRAPWATMHVRPGLHCRQSLRIPEQGMERRGIALKSLTSVPHFCAP